MGAHEHERVVHRHGQLDMPKVPRAGHVQEPACSAAAQAHRQHVSSPSLVLLQWSRQAMPAARFHWRRCSGKPANLSGVC